MARTRLGPWRKFSADTVVLHRYSAPAPWNGFSADVTYAGHASNDRFVGVTLNGMPTGGIDASWGISLNTPSWLPRRRRLSGS